MSPLAFSYASDGLGAARGSPLAFGLLDIVFPVRADANIANRIRSGVSEPRHYKLLLLIAALLPFPAFHPNAFPFFEGQKEGNAALRGALFVRYVSGVFWISSAIFARGFAAIRAHLLKIGSAVSAVPFGMIIGIGHGQLYRIARLSP